MPKQGYIKPGGRKHQVLRALAKQRTSVKASIIDEVVSFPQASGVHNALNDLWRSEPSLVDGYTDGGWRINDEGRKARRALDKAEKNK